MTARATNVKTKPPAFGPSLAILGYRDLELMGPRLAVWRCRCQVRNQQHFSRDVQVGFAYPNVMQCSGCSARYRGRLVIASAQALGGAA